MIYTIQNLNSKTYYSTASCGILFCKKMQPNGPACRGYDSVKKNWSASCGILFCKKNAAQWARVSRIRFCKKLN